MENKYLARDAIRKKLIGKRLSYKEIYSIMDEIAKDKLGDVLTTYFVASGYTNGFSNEEIFHLTKAMIETGEKLKFDGIVADKHSIGGVPGSRITMVVVPIVAAAGYKTPKSSSRAITTPAGTADAMEVLSNVSFTPKELYKIVDEVGGCMVWGGSFNIAPADDDIIKIEEPLLFESFDKILVSVMAKKIAFGATHIVIDLPYGKNVKLKKEEEAKILKRKFEFIASKFNVKLEAVIRKATQPAGSGIGPLLEAKDALLVLEQADDRPLELEKQAIEFAGELLDLCLKDDTKDRREEIGKKYKNGREWATEILSTKTAHQKMMDIIVAQGGKPKSSSDLKPATYSTIIRSKVSGMISEVNSHDITLIAKILGAPKTSSAGILLAKRHGDNVTKGEILARLYSNSRSKLAEAQKSLSTFPMYEVKNK